MDDDVPAAETLKLGKEGSSGGGVFWVPRMTIESRRISSMVKLFLSTVAVTEISFPNPIALSAGVNKNESKIASVAENFFISTNRFPRKQFLFSQLAFY